jgi:chemotaxis protein CheD
MPATADYTVSTSAHTANSHTVNMGQAVLGRSGDTLCAVLGSCIGVALHHPRHRVGVFAHVVLPDSIGHAGPPAKFADTAIPYLLHLLKTEGIAASGLVVKLAGGANMFAAKGPMQIGQANLDAVVAALQQANLRVAAQHVGGDKGRRARFDCHTGELFVEIAGTLTATL